MGTKGVDVVEFLFGAKVGDQIEAKAGTIKIAVCLFGRLKIEQMGFDRRPRADRGTDPDVGDARRECARHPRAIEPLDEHGVDSMGRQELGNAPQIGRRKPDGAPALVAADHRPRQRMGTSEHRIHVGEIARSHGPTHPRARPRALRVTHDVHRMRGESQLLAEFFERAEIALPRPAETKILPHHDALRVKLIDQHFRRELLGRALCQLVVERFDDHANGRHRFGDELDLALEGRQKPRRRSPENDRWRRVERERHGRHARELGLARRARQHLHVPAVDAVEIADRTEAGAVWHSGESGIQSASFFQFSAEKSKRRTPLGDETTRTLLRRSTLAWRAARVNFGYEHGVTPDEAIAEAKRGTIRPVYLLTGEEPYEIERVLSALRGLVLSGAMAAFNEEKLVAGEMAVDRVLAAARVVPMMAKQKLVVVRSIERWDARANEGESEEADTSRQSPLDRLAEYAAAPSPTACLVLIGAKIDGRRKLMNAGRKGGFLVACEPLPRGALPGFVTREATARGHVTGSEVADLLAEIAGPELGSVVDAIERLSLYVGPGQPITEDAIAACLVRMRQSTVWELVNAVGRRELGPALASLDDVYDARDRGLRLIGLLAWSLRQLIKFEAATRAGASPEEAARRAGAPPFKARDLAGQVRRLGADELQRWLLLLAGADLELKGSKRPARATIESTIMRMCHGPALNG